MLSVENLTQKYRFGSVAVRNVSFSVERGEVLCILGETESGKTSLLKTISGLLKANNGCILWDNRDMTTESIRDRNVCLLTNDMFYEKQSVYKNLSYVLSIRKIKQEIVSKRVEQAIVEYNLTYQKERKLNDLSQEERIRVILARASLRDADIYLVDDIFSKNENGEELFKKYYPYILDISNSASLIYTTSSTKEAISVNSNTLILRYGIPQQIGSIEEITKMPLTKYIFRLFYPSYSEQEGTLDDHGELRLLIDEQTYPLNKKHLLHSIFIGKKIVLCQNDSGTNKNIYDPISENLIYFKEILD